VPVPLSEISLAVVDETGDAADPACCQGRHHPRTRRIPGVVPSPRIRGPAV